MKSSKLLLPIALVSALTIGTPNISALERPYNGEGWITIDPSSGRVTLYPIDGVQMSQNEDGTVNLDTSIPNDTSKWDSQVSGVGSTQSYIYVGFHIKPVEGAVKLKSTCDAVNNTMDSAEITSDIDSVQCWYPIANYDNGAYSLFGSGRVYDALFGWRDEEQAVTFEKITLTLRGGNKEIFDEENGMGAIFAEAPIFLPNYRLEIKDVTDTHMDSLADKLKVNESLT